MHSFGLTKKKSHICHNIDEYHYRKYRHYHY